jgi:hypothetical protein
VQALQYENISAADRLEGARFVLPILKFAFLVRGQRPVQRGRDRSAQFGSRVQGEQRQSSISHRSIPIRIGGRQFNEPRRFDNNPSHPLQGRPGGYISRISG